MKTLILMLAAAVAFAQTPPPAPLQPGEAIRVIEVKQADAQGIYQTLRAVFPGVNVNGRMIIVRGPESVVGAIEEAVRKLDVTPAPPPESRPVANVEVTMQLLYGSGQDDPTAKVPADLEGTVRQLRTLFPYKSYRQLDAEVLRSRDTQVTSNSGTLPGSDSTYQFSYLARIAPGPAPHLVHLERLALQVAIKNKSGASFDRSEIHTDLDAREGQKTVVGKSNVTGTDDAIILVVTPKVLP